MESSLDSVGLTYIGEGAPSLLLFRNVLLALALVLGSAAPAWAEDYMDLPLEELGRVEIYTTTILASEKPTDEIAAAVTVLTGEDIKRSGVRTAVDALRMVPGLHVGKTNANTWIVTSRGYSSIYVRGLLVMLDGRSLASSQTGNVDWDRVDLVLDDIDRIDIIRGTGGAVWGANSFNGVINVVTKSSKDTQGGLVKLGLGTEDNLYAARYGGEISENTHYRVYAKGVDREKGGDIQENVYGIVGEGGDEWQSGIVGFRVDLEPSAADKLTLQGEYQDGDGELPTSTISLLAPPSLHISDVDLEAGSLMATWDREFSKNTKLHLQGYWDHVERTNQGVGGLKVDTYDLDFRVDRDYGRYGLFQWGLGWRQITGREAGDVDLTSVRRRETDLYQAFAQYEVPLVEDLMFLTLGSKYEHNDYTGSEFQPTVRLAVDTGDGTLWAAASRSVRTPLRIETDLNKLLAVVPCGLGCFETWTAVGSESLKSEELKSAELGYKHHLTSKLYAEVAAFYNDFEDIIEIDVNSAYPTLPPPVLPFPHTALNIPMNNIVSSNIWGGEANLEWQAYDWWKLGANYSYAKIRIKDAGSVGFTGGSGSAPRHQVKFISSADLRDDLSLDVMLYYIDEIKSMPSVSSRYDLDLRLAWRPTDHLEFALVGQNLFYHEKQQMEQFLFLGTATKRNGYLQLTWDF